MHSYNYAIIIHRGRSDAYDPIPARAGLDHAGVLVALEGRYRPILVEISAYLDILDGVDEIRR